MEVIDIGFDAITNPSERDYFMNLPTSFVLPAEDIDNLREMAGKLLRKSENYQTILDSFNEKTIH